MGDQFDRISTRSVRPSIQVMFSSQGWPDQSPIFDRHSWSWRHITTFGPRNYCKYSASECRDLWQILHGDSFPCVVESFLSHPIRLSPDQCVTSRTPKTQIKPVDGTKAHANAGKAWGSRSSLWGGAVRMCLSSSKPSPNEGRSTVMNRICHPQSITLFLCNLLSFGSCCKSSQDVKSKGVYPASNDT